MNYVYPAVFFHDADGRYSVNFPDLNNLATFGDNITDAFAMAQDACGGYLFTLLRDGEHIPPASSLDDIKTDDNAEFVNYIFVNLDEFARLYDDKAVKKTLSIPAWLNTACERENINYSRILQDALINKLQL